MKKVLLSLSMLAATVFAANAQDLTVGIGMNDDFATVGNSTDNPTGEYSYPVTLGGVDYTAGFFWYKDDAYASTYTKTRTGGEMAIAVNKGAEYSVIGAGFGDDNGATANGNPFYIDITNAKTFSVKIKASAAVTVKVQFEDATGKKIEANASSAEYAKTIGAAALNTYSTWTVDLTGGVGLAWPGPTQITGFNYAKVAKVNFLISGGAAYVGTVTFDDFKLGTSTNIGLGTAAAAANISSAVVYPNPSNGVVSANLTLQNPASVSMIVTDMVGKQIATQNFGTVSSLNGVTVFDASTLAKGLYTVTYVLDGTPAKTELVVVK